mmetsp:Transcript_18577/g.32980  ORF Transcript_18577/g.32980 Transcript_18577/m.32980 type:complete len:345 (+) Transcript_18577:243-1277(+)
MRRPALFSFGWSLVVPKVIASLALAFALALATSAGLTSPLLAIIPAASGCAAPLVLGLRPGPFLLCPVGRPVILGSRLGRPVIPGSRPGLRLLPTRRLLAQGGPALLFPGRSRSLAGLASPGAGLLRPVLLLPFLTPWGPGSPRLLLIPTLTLWYPRGSLRLRLWRFCHQLVELVMAPLSGVVRRRLVALLALATTFPGLLGLFLTLRALTFFLLISILGIYLFDILFCLTIIVQEVADIPRNLDLWVFFLLLLLASLLPLLFVCIIFILLLFILFLLIPLLPALSALLAALGLIDALGSALATLGFPLGGTLRALGGLCLLLYNAAVDVIVVGGARGGDAESL